MVTLQEILFIAGYTNINAQIAYIKLLAYRDCFSKPTLVPDEKSAAAARRQSAIEQWEKSLLKESYSTHYNNIISTTEAEEFLKITFPSYEEGFEWLLSITQLKFLRESLILKAWEKTKKARALTY